MGLPLCIRTVLERQGADDAVAFHLRALFASPDRLLLKTTSFSTVADDNRLHRFLAALCIKHAVAPTTAVVKYAK
jgi:hypothetical protein